MTKNEVYLKALNDIWKCVDHKHLEYNGRDKPTICELDHSYDEDAVDEKQCMRATEILNKLWYADLLDDCLTVFDIKTGTFTFEWYDDQDHNCELELNSKYDGEDADKMTWILDHPSIKVTHNGKSSGCEINCKICFLEEVENKIKWFLEDMKQRKG